MEMTVGPQKRRREVTVMDSEDEPLSSAVSAYIRFFFSGNPPRSVHRRSSNWWSKETPVSTDADWKRSHAGPGAGQDVSISMGGRLWSSFISRLSGGEKQEDKVSPWLTESRANEKSSKATWLSLPPQNSTGHSEWGISATKEIHY